MSDLIYNFFYKIFSFLPDLNFSIPEDVKNTFFDVVRGAIYFFPIKLCLPIIFFSLTLIGVRMTLVIYKFIKSHIPNMS